MDLRERSERRVSEHAVAEVLESIGAPRNRRTIPEADDLPGEFDFWFDGGAAKVQTGYADYLFVDGTRARVAGPIPALSVSIEFPNGCRVTVRQETWELDTAG